MKACVKIDKKHQHKQLLHNIINTMQSTTLNNIPTKTDAFNIITNKHEKFKQLVITTQPDTTQPDTSSTYTNMLYMRTSTQNYTYQCTHNGTLADIKQNTFMMFARYYMEHVVTSKIGHTLV